MINIIVFSKDRAMQLDYLLRTMDMYYADLRAPRWLPVTVLYRASSASYQQGYDKLRYMHPWARFIEETDFRAQTLSYTDSAMPYVQYFVDDMVFMRPFSLDNDRFVRFQDNNDILTVSLRLGCNIRHCYMMDIPTRVPVLIDGCWDWRRGMGDWGYPMSIDGNIYRTRDILPLIHRCQWHTPNTLEAAMAAQPIAKPYMTCYDTSIVCNVPANSVGEFKDNRVMDGSAGWLNDQFLAGKRIALSTCDGLVPVSPHVELYYKLEDAA